MGKEMITRNELAAKAEIEAVEIDLWTKAKILKPVGFTEDKTPCYDASDAERAAHVRKLREIGYGLEEIQKIIKKYGWPQAKAGVGAAADKNKLLTVGQLAEKAGVSPRTIKHWEEVGILDPDLRSEGGFRLYDKSYVFLCQLIRDLQLFGYSLDEIKSVSDFVRDFFALHNDLNAFSPDQASAKLDELLKAATSLNERMRQLREGLDRWEDLLKKKRKEIAGFKAKNAKRAAIAGEKVHA